MAVARQLRDAAELFEGPGGLAALASYFAGVPVNLTLEVILSCDRLGGSGE
ncbi:hypothetical protein ACGFMK_20915 [Amycolatopsis sp. NPDC049252]|uniref:hypothetical protein n=1 Tax=Amycolatopsis sp. NPDC049252 TaxID=3363933 RepID=UPI00371AF1ED